MIRKERKLNNKGYEYEAITEFIVLAQEIGILLAMRELGYPKTWNTANKWFEQRGIARPDPLNRTMANVNKQAYTIAEKLQTGYMLLERIGMMLSDADPLDTANIKQLSESYKKTIETIQLLEGKATNISQTNDSFDTNYQSLLDQMEAKNQEAQAILAGEHDS